MSMQQEFNNIKNSKYPVNTKRFCNIVYFGTPKLPDFLPTDCNVAISLSQFPKIALYKLITVRVKVIHSYPPQQQVSNKQHDTMQDVIIADSTNPLGRFSQNNGEGKIILNKKKWLSTRQPEKDVFWRKLSHWKDLWQM